jgi:plastocyanin
MGHPDAMDDADHSRRRVLVALSGGGLAALAGCSGDDGDGGTDPPPTDATTAQSTATATATADDPPAPTTDEQRTMEATTDRSVYHVAPGGDDGADGTADRPLRTVAEGLARAEPGETVRLAPGEYRELVRTVRDGEPDAPITVEGPPEAVIRPTRAVNDCVLIEHHHFRIRGVTVDGLADPDRKFADYEAWMPRLVNISPLGRRDEGVEYVRDVVVEPSRMGNAARAMVQVERVRGASIGNFEVIGPAGMQFDRRVDNHDPGHIREIVYVGSPEVHRGEPYYGFDTLDRTSDVRIHHIDNSAGYRHNELVDVKLGSERITVEYCTDRNAGHNSDGGRNAAIDVKGNDCTVRWNDVGVCTTAVSFGAWAPSPDVDGGDWSRNNAVYGNRLHDFAAGAFRLRNTGDSGPVSFDDQRAICGNEIDRGDAPLERWVGDANGFDGGVDERGRDEVTVTVGADGGRALDPAGVLVDPGTTVTWEWTGDDEHYVVIEGRVDADPDTVPDPRAAPYSESTTLDYVSLFEFACYAHHDEGMRGAVVVVENEDRYAFARESCEGLPDGDGVGHTGGDGRWA